MRGVSEKVDNVHFIEKLDTFICISELQFFNSVYNNMAEIMQYDH
jgi:hypothetical protein